MGKALICPTVALDDIYLPGKVMNNVLGGSAAYAALASRLFTETVLSSIVGKDFPMKYWDLLESKGIDMSLVQRSKSKLTFKWVAKYSEDLKELTTLRNDMNAFDDYDVKPLKKICKNKDCQVAYVSNIDPELQVKILKTLPKRSAKIIDSMELWMIEKRAALREALRMVDVFIISEKEAKYMVDGNPALPELIEKIMQLGPKVVIYKKGEHGLILFGQKGNMVVPSYPMTYAVDPSGAGPALGGTIAGVLAKLGRFDEKAMKTAVFLGSVVASYVVEDYGIDGLAGLIREEILNRAGLFLSQLPSGSSVNIDEVLK